MIYRMTKIKLIELEEKTKGTCLVAFVTDNILSTSTLRILTEVEKEKGIQVYSINVEEEKESLYKFSLRIIPTIFVYESGELITKINLPFSKRDLECLIK